MIIRKPGILSSIQDMGRLFHLSEAVPLSGPVDRLSARIANRAVGNDDNAPVIEFTYGGAEMVAVTELLLAVSGEGATLEVHSPSAVFLPLPHDRPLYIPAGTLLSLKTNGSGCRLYMAVAGGWEVPELMGSKSTYLTAGFGGYNGRPLKAGDLLQSESEWSTVSGNLLGLLQGSKINYPAWSIARRLFLPECGHRIRVMAGSEFEWFDSKSREAFFTTSYRVSADSNRMACVLEGPAIKLMPDLQMISTAVTPGTLQVPGNGQPIILLADAQTTGGYPRIAQVAAVDLPLCGQLRPGDSVMFTQITWDEAERLYFAQEHQLAEMTAAIASHTFFNVF